MAFPANTEFAGATELPDPNFLRFRFLGDHHPATFTQATIRTPHVTGHAAAAPTTAHQARANPAAHTPRATPAHHDQDATIVNHALGGE